VPAARGSRACRAACGPQSRKRSSHAAHAAKSGGRSCRRRVAGGRCGAVPSWPGTRGGRAPKSSRRMGSERVRRAAGDSPCSHAAGGGCVSWSPRRPSMPWAHEACIGHESDSCLGRPTDTNTNQIHALETPEAAIASPWPRLRAHRRRCWHPSQSSTALETGTRYKARLLNAGTATARACEHRRAHMYAPTTRHPSLRPLGLRRPCPHCRPEQSLPLRLPPARRGPERIPPRPTHQQAERCVAEGHGSADGARGDLVKRGLGFSPP
jgi:hypothetical protein